MHYRFAFSLNGTAHKLYSILQAISVLLRQEHNIFKTDIAKFSFLNFFSQFLNQCLFILLSMEQEEIYFIPFHFVLDGAFLDFGSQIFTNK